MGQTIFPVLSLDRSLVRWEEQASNLTPFEQHEGLFFKREDYFAPLGYAGINGAKVRQLAWLLVNDYLPRVPPGGNPGLIYAGSVRSPQIGRVPTVAKHFGLPSIIVLGSHVSTAVKHENVAIAARMGAEFVKAPAPYNPSLQATARKLLAEPAWKDYYQVEYGLSVEGTPERIEAFYRFASGQVSNLPDDVETLLVPAGSCNTTLSVLYGVARYLPPRLRRIVLVGIGPTRIEWYEARLTLLEKFWGKPVGSLFRRVYHHHPDLARQHGDATGRYELHHYDLFSTKWSSWEKEHRGVRWGSIDLHPSYEAKMLDYMKRHPDLSEVLRSGKACFWIVGSEPRLSVMEPYIGQGDAL